MLRAVGKLETRLGALTERVAALENKAPTSNVEGRTYCFVLDLTMMRGMGVNETEELVTSIIRRTATFSGGTFTAQPISHIRNAQTQSTRTPRP